MPATGTQIGQYEIIEFIGVGGMGEIWQARDTPLERGDPIKMLPDDMANDPECMACLEGEAKLLASPCHPHIAGVRRLWWRKTRDCGEYLSPIGLVVAGVGRAVPQH